MPSIRPGANGASLPALRPRLAAWGHSYVEGYGAKHVGYAWPSVCARLLGVDDENNGMGSTALQGNWGGGNMYGTFNRIVGTLPFWGGSAVGRGPLVQLAAIYSAINDMGTAPLGAISDAQIVVGHMRACIAKLRHVMGGLANDASWAFAQGGGAANWGATTAFNIFPTFGKPTGDNGNTWTITLPAGFPGGTVRIFSMANNASGSLHTITLDGAAQATWDTRTASNATYRPYCYTLANLGPGAHTIVGTITNRVGIEWLHFWALDGTDNPPVLYANLNRAPVYPNPLTDAQVATLNAALTPLAAEFTDGRVVCVDADSALGYTTAGGDTSNFDMVGLGAGTPTGGTAGVHPNERGHAKIALAFADAFRTLALQSKWPAEATMAQALVQDQKTVLPLRMLEAAGATSSQSDPYLLPRCIAITLVAGTQTWTSRSITANTRVLSCNPIGDPAGANSGTVGVVSITASSGTTAGTIIVKSTNAADTRVVHLAIYEAVPMIVGASPPNWS